MECTQGDLAPWLIWPRESRLPADHFRGCLRQCTWQAAKTKIILGGLSPNGETSSDALHAQFAR